MRNRTLEYAKKVVNGEILKGKTEIQCCQRFIDDLERQNTDDFEYYFDNEEAEKYIEIANTLTILEGEEIKKLKTRGFQDFIIGNLHGWFKKDNDTNRFKEAYIQIGRQNGKSFLSGIEGINWSTFMKYREGRILLGATKQEQANIVWNEIAKFIRADENINELYKITEHIKTIKSLVTGTEIKSVGRDTKSLDGFRTILSVIDEYHAHQTNQMYSLLFDGQKNVASALTLSITTAGFTIDGPCHQHYRMCKNVVQGNFKKETQFVFICEPDEGDDLSDYRVWAKANPLVLWNPDDTYNEEMIDKMREKYNTAQEKQGEDLVNFMTKDLNMWVTNAGNLLLDHDKLLKCKSDKTLEDMRGRECYLGIDLSSGGDLTSIALVFPLSEEKAFIHCHSFMPNQRLLEHERTDKVPYRLWVNKGLLTLTYGASEIKTDYKFIVQYLKEIKEKYDLKFIDCGYDPHNAGAFISDLDFLGCDLTEIVQSARSLNDATVDFKLSVKGEQIEFNKDDAIFLWSCSNATTDVNSFGEIKVDKKTNGRIDLVDAVIDAWKLYFLNKDTYKYNADDDVEDWFDLMESFKK